MQELILDVVHKTWNSLLVFLISLKCQWILVGMCLVFRLLYLYHLFSISQKNYLQSEHFVDKKIATTVIWCYMYICSLWLKCSNKYLYTKCVLRINQQLKNSVKNTLPFISTRSQKDNTSINYGTDFEQVFFSLLSSQIFVSYFFR